MAARELIKTFGIETDHYQAPRGCNVYQDSIVHFNNIPLGVGSKNPDIKPICRV